ncbi:MAG: hypothetical protein ABIH23_16620 [bacterium]
MKLQKRDTDGKLLRFSSGKLMGACCCGLDGYIDLMDPTYLLMYQKWDSWAATNTASDSDPAVAYSKGAADLAAFGYQVNPSTDGYYDGFQTTWAGPQHVVHPVGWNKWAAARYGWSRTIYGSMGTYYPRFYQLLQIAKGDWDATGAVPNGDEYATGLWYQLTTTYTSGCQDTTNEWSSETASHDLAGWANGAGQIVETFWEPDSGVVTGTVNIAYRTDLICACADDAYAGATPNSTGAPGWPIGAPVFAGHGWYISATNLTAIRLYYRT